MSALTRAADARLAPDRTEAAFKEWLRRLVTGSAELMAFDAGQVDAVMDHASASAILLPEAQTALQGVNRIVLSALDGLPAEVCVLDSSGSVVMTNKAWRTGAVAHARAGLDVREGESFFMACRDAPSRERARAALVAAGLRQVLAGARASVRRTYVCHVAGRRYVCTLSITAIAGSAPCNALLTRVWEVEPGARVSNVQPARAGKSQAAAPPDPRRASETAFGADNRLLAALTPREYARLAPGLEAVELTYGDVLYEPGEPLRQVYFPRTCLVSLLTLVEGHRALEVGLVGREGMIGGSLALGAQRSSVRALVQGTGGALRMTASRFLQEFKRCPALRRVLFQFTDSLMIQISQTAACNRFHMVEARLARWLLMTAERMDSAQFHLTHEFLADMLGVRREGVTVAASALQRRELIRYRRGNISILDRPGLEKVSCPCFRHLQASTR